MSSVYRFQLRVHRETKTGDVHELTRTDKPLGLSPAKIPEGRDPRSIRGDIGYAVARWVIRSYSMPQSAEFASSRVVRARVVDLTNVSGLYDYTLRICKLQIPLGWGRYPRHRDPVVASADRQCFHEAALAVLVVNGKRQISLRHPNTTDFNRGRYRQRRKEMNVRRLAVSGLDFVEK